MYILHRPSTVTGANKGIIFGFLLRKANPTAPNILFPFPLPILNDLNGPVPSPPKINLFLNSWSFCSGFSFGVLHGDFPDPEGDPAHLDDVAFCDPDTLFSKRGLYVNVLKPRVSSHMPHAPIIEVFVQQGGWRWRRDVKQSRRKREREQALCRQRRLNQRKRLRQGMEAERRSSGRGGSGEGEVGGQRGRGQRGCHVAAVVVEEAVRVV